MISREIEARSYYELGLKRVRETPEPIGQKFPCGSKVRIADDLGPCMSHFKSGVEAIVEYVYAHAFGGTDIKSYSLKINGYSYAWYYEHQLELITGD